MGRKKRFGDSDINLTPLLDVLFSILFIVMLGSAGNEARTRAEAQETVDSMQAEVDSLNSSINDMTVQAENYREQISRLERESRGAQGRLEDYEMYRRDGMIISIQNSIDASGHILKVFVNESEQPYETIQLGIDLTDYTSKRIKSIISELVDQVDNAPVFIVFRCEKNLIYTLEFNAVNSALDLMQDGYKEVFYKRIMIE